MYEYLLVTLLGILFGVITGLMPGIHPNTVIFAILPMYFIIDVSFEIFAAFVIGLSVCHTFLDSLPAIFLGAPEADDALVTLPGAEMAANGKGLEAYKYTVYGGLTSFIIVLAVIPLLFNFLDGVYSAIDEHMEFFILFFLLFIIFKADNEFDAAIVAGLSGFLGVLTFNIPVNQSYILLPIFAGLFAVPSIYKGLKEDFSIPVQAEPEVNITTSVRGGFLGSIAGIISGLFPGIGVAIATTFLTPWMKDAKEEFLAGMGGVNTADIIISFIALYLIGRARSGAAVALQSITEITLTQVYFFIALSVFSAVISFLVSFKGSKLFLKVIKSIDFSKVLITVFFLLFFISYNLTGLIGVFIFIIASFIGYTSLLVEERSACMAVLMVPTIIFFSGFGIHI